jgi:hypothetical protein
VRTRQPKVAPGGEEVKSTEKERKMERWR